jgi:exodeoxyribonuclease VIII
MEEKMKLDLTNEAYHARPEISSSDVKLVAAKSLLHWKNKVYKSSAAFDLGTAVHALCLEPEKDLIMRGPEDRRGNKWKDAKLAADLDGKLLLTEDDYDLAQRMSDSVRSHPAGKMWLEAKDMLAEGSFFAEDEQTGVEIKCRPDGYVASMGLIFDIKTTQDASPNGFPRDLRKYGYDLQAAFYRRVMRQHGAGSLEFYFLCVEKEAPYAVCAHTLSDEYILQADAKVTQVLHEIANAEASNDYQTGWPLCNVIDLPRWQIEQPEEDIFTDY